MGFEEFRDKIQKKSQKKHAKVRNSYGVYDVYKVIRKKKWFNIGRPLTEHEFYSIIREVNNLLAEEMAKGNTVVFPLRMGKLELRKRKAGAVISNGKLKVNYPVDWKETLLLWYRDEEAKANKTLIRNECNEVYYVKYNKHNATYENKCFYEFALNRFIKRALKDNIIKGKIDTLW